MNAAMSNFLSARQRYDQLECARIRRRTPEERERFHIALMRAWLDLHYHAQIVAGMRFEKGMQFAKVN